MFPVSGISDFRHQTTTHFSMFLAASGISADRAGKQVRPGPKKCLNPKKKLIKTSDENTVSTASEIFADLTTQITQKVALFASRSLSLFKKSGIVGLANKTQITQKVAFSCLILAFHKNSIKKIGISF